MLDPPTSYIYTDRRPISQQAQNSNHIKKNASDKLHTNRICTKQIIYAHWIYIYMYTYIHYCSSLHKLKLRKCERDRAAEITKPLSTEWIQFCFCLLCGVRIFVRPMLSLPQTRQTRSLFVSMSGLCKKNWAMQLRILVLAYRGNYIRYACAGMSSIECYIL